MKHKKIKISLALQGSMPKGPDDGFSCKCSYSPEGNVWISVFRRQIMKKKLGLNLALKDGQAEKNLVVFHQRGW